MVWPVMAPARSEDRNKIKSAISLDSTMRPMGMLATARLSASATDMFPCSALAFKLRSCLSVLVVPGWMQLTKIPSEAKESERFLAMLETDALVTPLLFARVFAERAFLRNFNRFADCAEAVERSVHRCEMQEKAKAKVSQSYKVQIGASGGTNL